MDRFKILARFLLNSELLKSASILAIGTLIAQAIPILLQPVLRRFFTPEQFGVYSVYVSMLGILLIISSFRYEQAIVLPKKDKDSSNLLSLSIGISFLFSVILLIISLIFKNKILVLLNIKPDFSYIIYLIPLGTFLISTFYALNYWLIRKKAFLAISGNKLTRRLFEGVSQVTFAFKDFNKGLIVGDVLGQSANVVASYYQSARNGFSIKEFRFSKTKYLIRKYSIFPKYNLLPSLMSAISNLVPVIFINRFYYSEQAGYFDLTKLVLSIPLALIASSFSSVLLQKVSEHHRNNQSVLNDLYPIFFATFFIAIVEVIIILLFGTGLFTIFFGNAWETSGQISKILVWSFALNFIAASFSPMFIALNRVKMYSLWQTIYFFSIITLVFFRNHPFLVFLKIFVAIEVFCNLLSIALMIYILLNYEKRLRVSKI